MFLSGLIVLIFVAACHSDELPASLSRHKRVIGGDQYQRGKYPFLVSLWYSGENNFTRPGLPHMCGGFLVREQWVLTAGHCFDNGFMDGLDDVSLWTVYLGMHTQQDAEDQAQKRRIQRVFKLPEYNGSDMSNDIALLKLDKPATLDNTVDLIALNGDLHCPSDGQDCLILGWGQTQNETYGPSSNVAHEATLSVVNLQYCKSLYNTPEVIESYSEGGSPPRIDERNLCAGIPKGGVDTCSGDSGGPLMATCGRNSQAVVGIVSHGYGCAKPGIPGVYTRVSSYNEWINSTISNNS